MWACEGSAECGWGQTRHPASSRRHANSTGQSPSCDESCFHLRARVRSALARPTPNLSDTTVTELNPVHQQLREQLMRSEVELAVSARERLEKSGKKVRVVRAPCLELFDKADRAYQDKVLPPGVKRVSIEAGITGPWRRWVGEGGLSIGIDHYGASAPDKVLAQKFGLTADSVTDRIQKYLG